MAPTLQGLLLLLLGPLALLLGAVRGSDGLLLVGAVALALALVGLCSSWRTIRTVSCRRILPGPLFARRRGEVFLEVEARGPLGLPVVLDVSDHAVEAPDRPPVRIARRTGVRVPPDGVVVRYPAYVRRRGEVPFTHVRVATTSPLGLFRVSRTIPLEETVRVLPRPGTLRVSLEPVDSTRTRVEERLVTSRPGTGREFHALREFRSGDDPRRIHWPSSVKRPGPLLVREEAGRVERRHRVTLDVTEVRTLGRARPLERAISFAATLAIELRRSGRAVSFRLRTTDGETEVPDIRPRVALRRVLEELAVVEGPDGDADVDPPVLEGLAPGILVRAAPLPDDRLPPAGLRVVDAGSDELERLFEWDVDLEAAEEGLRAEEVPA